MPEAGVQAQDYAKGLKNVVALKKELEAYQVPDPTVDEIERLERLILELDVYHQQLLLSVARYKTALEASFKGEAELLELQAKVTLYDDMVKALAPGASPAWMIAEAMAALWNVSIRSA